MIETHSVEKRMLRWTRKEDSLRSPDANEIRKRIDARAAAFHQKHGAMVISPISDKERKKLSALYIHDPASETPRAFDPDGVAKALGANLHTGRRSR
jgi:hypothetical protein